MSRGPSAPKANPRAAQSSWGELTPTSARIKSARCHPAARARCGQCTRQTTILAIGHPGEQKDAARGRSPAECSAPARSPKSPRCIRAREPYSARRRPAFSSACYFVRRGREARRSGPHCAAAPQGLGPARAARQQGSNRAWRRRGPRHRRYNRRFCPASGPGHRQRPAPARTEPGW